MTLPLDLLAPSFRAALLDCIDDRGQFYPEKWTALMDAYRLGARMEGILLTALARASVRPREPRLVDARWN